MRKQDAFLEGKTPDRIARCDEGCDGMEEMEEMEENSTESTNGISMMLTEPGKGCPIYTGCVISFVISVKFYKNLVMAGMLSVAVILMLSMNMEWTLKKIA